MRHYKTYDLNGQTVMAKATGNQRDCYPWEGAAVPVKIMAEYHNFLVGIVLPHKNPKGMGQSKEYRITLDKFDLETGSMVLSTMDGQRI